MDIDKPLDEMIKSKPRQQRKGGRGGSRSASAGAPASGGAGAGGARQRYASNTPTGNKQVNAKINQAAQKPLGGDATKVIISNLPMDVTEAAVRDLMQSTVGPVKNVQMAYNAQGKSTGVATVVFKNRGDGNKAHGAYHNRMIDNQRPMKVEIALDPSQLQSLASRVSAPPAARNAGPAGAGRGGRGGGGGGRGGGKPRTARPKPKTAEELDAEMSAYKETGTTA